MCQSIHWLGIFSEEKESASFTHQKWVILHTFVQNYLSLIFSVLLLPRIPFLSFNFDWFQAKLYRKQSPNWCNNQHVDDTQLLTPVDKLTNRCLRMRLLAKQFLRLSQHCPRQYTTLVPTSPPPSLHCSTIRLP